MNNCAYTIKSSSIVQDLYQQIYSMSVIYGTLSLSLSQLESETNVNNHIFKWKLEVN